MKKRNTKNRRKVSRLSKKSSYHSLFVLLAVSFFLIGSVHIYRILHSEIKSVTENSKDSTKRIPAEVQKTLKPNFSPSYKVPILLYHYVEYVNDKKDTIRQSLNIEPNIFEQQVKTLYDNGYTFMTAKEFGDVITGKKSLPPKPVILTFDDGHYDLDTVILPILKKYHAKATAYIIPGFIGDSDFLTEGEMRDVVNSGIIDVGAHTVHHIYLKDKFKPLVKYEVDQSRKMLKQNYGVNVVSFAYPDGAFDQQAIDLTREAGFTTAVTTIPGIIQSEQNRFFLFRLRPGYRTGNDLINYFNQVQFKPY